MNFVETEKPLFIAPTTKGLAEESISASPAKASTGLCSKTFVGSMALTMVVFSFTLSGMMSASNWIVDQYVIPKVVAKSSELSKPLAPLPADNSETPTDAAASLR